MTQAKECPLCRAKIFSALGMNAVSHQLDRNPAADGDFTISSGRAVPWTKDMAENVKRYQKHQCGRKR